ncbi:MAG: hypothetical protein R3E83_21280 [Burkholderiaceae bacterium]
MIGKVLAVNAESGFIAVKAPGGLTIMELLGGNQVARGDLIRGDLESLNEEMFFNETRADQISVVVQDICCTPADARRWLQS